MSKLKTRATSLEVSANGNSENSAETQTSANGRRELAEFRLPSVLVGRIAAIRESGEPQVDFPGNTSGELVPARSLVPLDAADSGREIALTFEDGDSSKPVIVGLLQTSQPASISRRVKLDNESLVLSAKREVVIQCGKASITLTAAGKVLIRGEYVLSRSKGVNKVQGGSVQLN